MIIIPIPDNVKAYHSVDQLEVLSKADVFLTHNGMNSTSESLYMGTPMVFFPQNNEQRAVARRAKEMGTGIDLKEESVQGIHDAIMEVLSKREYSENAMKCSEDFRNAAGPSGAAEFIETAPHLMPEEDRKSIRREVIPGILELLFWCIAIAFIINFKALTGSDKWWIAAIAVNVIFPIYKNCIAKIKF